MLISIQILRALAAWLVVGHHIVQFLPELVERSALARLFAVYGAYGVDLFFVISGFVIYISSSRKAITPREFLAHRVARVVPAYWIFTALTALVLMLDSAFVPLTRLEWPFFLKSLFFVPALNPSGIGRYPLLTVGWTLNYEMAFYLVYFLSMFAPAKFRAPLVFVGILLLNLAVPWLGGAFVFYGDRIVFEFLFGVMAGIAHARGAISRTPGWVAILFILGAVAAIATHGARAHHFLYVGLPCAAILIASVSYERYFSKYRRFARFGDLSYSTYLCHVLILSVAVRVHQAGRMAMPVLLVCTVLAVACVSWLTFTCIENRASKSVRRMMATS